MKTCTLCQIEKSLDEFNKDKIKKDGRSSRCRDCNKHTSKLNYAKNKAKMREQFKQHHLDNKEKINENKRRYRKENKESISVYKKEYYQKNKERMNQYKKDRYANDENFNTRSRLSSRLKKCMNSKKSTTTMNYIGISLEGLKNHLTSTLNKEWDKEDLHIDHIIPCSLYDHTNEEDVFKCWNYRNLRYLPSAINFSKSNILDMGLVRQYNIEDLLPSSLREEK